MGPLNVLIDDIATNKPGVICVDHNTGWSVATHSRDGVHPNEAGEELMGCTWYDAVRQCAEPCPGFVFPFGEPCGCNGYVPCLGLESAAPVSIGLPICLVGDGFAPSSAAMGYLGVSRTTGAGYALPRVLGGTTCYQHTSRDYPFPLTSDSTGKVEYKFSTTTGPVSPSLLGQPLYFQIQALACGSEAIATNAIEVKLGGGGL